MTEFPRKNENIIPSEIAEKMVTFSRGYPKLKPLIIKKIMNELQKIYPFDRFVEDNGAIGWFECATPYIDIAIGINEFTFAYFDILGPHLLKTRKSLNISRLNQQDLAYLIAKNTEWREKAEKETLRRMVFSTQTSIKHKKHFDNIFLHILMTL